MRRQYHIKVSLQKATGNRAREHGENGKFGLRDSLNDKAKSRKGVTRRSGYGRELPIKRGAGNTARGYRMKGN